MLEFIGLVALIYLAWKYLPDFVWFFVKFVVAGCIIFLAFLVCLMVFANWPFVVIV